MTEEEAFALDEYYTKNPPKVDPSKIHIRIPMVRIDSDMTDEEYDALDEELTHTVPTLGPNGIGFLSQREMYHLGFSNMTVNYLMTKVKAANKSPAQLIDELVGREIAASV